jgi:hypothetical protein
MVQRVVSLKSAIADATHQQLEAELDIIELESEVRGRW